VSSTPIDTPVLTRTGASYAGQIKGTRGEVRLAYLASRIEDLSAWDITYGRGSYRTKLPYTAVCCPGNATIQWR